MEGGRVLSIILGVCAVLLQLIVAPLLTIGGVCPNFPVIAVVCLVVLQPSVTHYGFAFAMGLCFDLLSQGTVGTSSLVLIGCAFALPYLVDTIGNDQLLMALGLLFAGLVASELLIAVFHAGASGVSLPAALVSIVLPGIFYDLVIAALLYALLSRLGAGNMQGRSGTSVSNLRFR